MTALIAPSRATSFEGLIFFVYDREAVKKEADPPENAIVYFYPPSASIEDRISICGQLIGMSYFIHGFIGSRPALCKLQTEKALGGSLDEPDSLLIRQLGTLHSIFTFYHGSLERIRMMCETQKQFLTRMNVIWDCYLHFVRHYGDFLPGVFDPLPFLDLPKRVATTCFTKASYILQACQRRKHILGGCILYSNSILCTQFEPSITERLILLKPNQSNHPAKPVKTEHALPFGVRILNAFLTLSEYLNLYEALSDSAYRQPTSPESTGTFPDMYMTSQSSAGSRNPSGDPSGDKLQQVSSDAGANSSEGSGRGSTERENDSVVNSDGSLASALPSDAAVGAEIQTEKEWKDFNITDEREPILKRGTECSSRKGFRDEDFDNSDQSSGESRSELKATGTRKICAHNSGEFDCRNEHGVGTAVEKNEETEKPNESGACALKDVKKAGKEEIGSVAGALLTEKGTGKAKDESEAGALIAEKTTGKVQKGSEASELEAEKRTGEEKDASEANAMITEKRTGEEQSGSEVSILKIEESSDSILVKSGHSVVDEVDAPAFDSSSCESTSCNSVSLSMEGVDILGLKVTTNYITAFDSSSSESTLSNDVSLTMEAIDVSGLKVVQCSSSQIGELACLGGDKIVPCSSSNGSKRRAIKSLENEDTAICALVLEELITQVWEMIENENSRLDNDGVKCATALGACCQSCADAQKSRDVSSQGTKVCVSHDQKAGSNVTCAKTDAPSIDQDLERELANLLPGLQETKLRASDHRDGEETNCSRQTERPGSAKNIVITDAYLSKDHSFRSDLVKTPIVCDSFSVRNLNSRSPEKFLEKSFTCTDTGILDYSESANTDASCSTVVGATSGIRKTERNVSENANSNGTFSMEDGHRMPVETSQIRETERHAKVNASSSGASSADIEDGNPVTPSHLSIEFDSEIHIANGHEGPSVAGEIGVPVDTAREEIEDSSPRDQWREPPLPSHPDVEEEEELWSEEEGDDLNQVEGLTHVNLYVQAHSKVVLILLAEEGLNTDCNAIKALWETSLNQLGELEFLVKQSSGNETTTLHSDEYSFLVYDGFERTMKGNLNELVHQVDHLFCETTKVLHEQFENCSTLKDVMLRNHSSTVYGKRNLGRGTYFHSKASYRTTPGVPSHRDPFLKLEKRATKVLNKEHGVNIF